MASCRKLILLMNQHTGTRVFISKLRPLPSAVVYVDRSITFKTKSNQKENDDDDLQQTLNSYRKSKIIVGTAVLAGAGGAVLATPLALTAAGFGAAGIAAGSVAASMMSGAATTGVGMAVVSALQSAGAAGIGLAANALIGLGGASVGGTLAGAAVGKVTRNVQSKENQAKGNELNDKFIDNIPVNQSSSGDKEKYSFLVIVECKIGSLLSVKMAPKKSTVKKGLIIGGVITGATVSAVGAVLVAPVVVGALGFGAAGIAAGSVGASMMSAAATSGFGMGIVSVLQSVGAVGFGVAANALIGVGGAAVGGGVAAAAGDAVVKTKKNKDSNSADASTSTEPETDEIPSKQKYENVMWRRRRNKSSQENIRSDTVGDVTTSEDDDNIDSGDEIIFGGVLSLN
ncbi:interferon alpha-inducible protein 27 protein 2 [Biomphalaria glabrata]|nr:interferon alpha-inducible protein 27 protein 2 [Biomphalaria glabrata]